MNQCPNGHQNRPGAKFCSVCRTAIPQPPQQPPSYAPPYVTPAGQTPASRFPKRTWLFVAVAAVLLLVIGAGAFLIFPGDDNETAVVDETPTAEPEESEDEDSATPESDDETDEDATPMPTAVAEETPVSAPITVTNILTNGNFTDNWDAGWQRTLGPNVSGQNQIELSDLDFGSSGRGVHIAHTGPDALQLEQIQPITSGNLQFQAQVALAGSVNPVDNSEGMAVLMLTYKDAAFTPLGYSLWISGVQRETTLLGQGPLPPIGPNVALHWMGENRSIDVDVRQEILNGVTSIVDPNSVRNITVTLIAIGDPLCAPDKCAVDIQATDIILSQE